MLTLEHKITLDEETIKASNLTDRFSEDDLKRLGEWCGEGFERDKQSRATWLRRNEAGMDLALQLQRDKTFPWVGCSNVAFPLVTIAAMQFHARAYPAVISGTDVVKARVIGPDPDGAQKARAAKISSHMSWQCLEEDQAWEEQHDKGMLNYSIVGCNFMKSYYDAGEGHNVSELVLAKDFVINYWSKSVETAKRKTQCFPLFRDDIYSKVKRKVYRDVLNESWYRQPPADQGNDSRAQTDRRQGVSPPMPDEITPFKGREMHVVLDLDKDGYAEPYIIDYEEDSKYVLRIRCGFQGEADIERTPDGDVISIRREQYFTKYGFIPSADGGIYDTGFGVLLGPLNESVNTALNQIFDAGTMATTAGGFLARGAKIRGGTYTFAPFGWNRVDSTGDDLRKSIFPLPVREPSTILFQVLTLLIDYTSRISGSTDMLVGENPGQNTPAETARAMVEQGTKIFNALFKRYWRCMKEEFRKLFILNALFLPDQPLGFGTAGQSVTRADYLGNPQSVVPAADPNLSSKTEQINKAMAVKAAAQTSGGYDPDAVERFYLSALDVPEEEIQKLYPGVAGKEPQPSEKVQIQMMKSQDSAQALQAEMMRFAAQLQEDRRVNSAEIMKILGELQIAQASAQGDESDRMINAMNTQLGLLKQKDERLSADFERIFRTLELQQGNKELELKEKEIEVKKKQAERPRAAA